MRPQLLKLPFPNSSSFYYSRYDCNYFDRPWHFHKELELVYIAKSKGTKFIGNQVCRFEDGDLTFIGRDIPHYYRNDEMYYEPGSIDQASSIFIHFNPLFLGNYFFDIPEFKKIKKLLSYASLALQIEGETKSKVIEILIRIEFEDAAKRILSLLQILDILSTSTHLKPILSTAFIGKNNHDADKINKVFNYIMVNYTREIYLQEIADELHMSPAAFSRYFKAHTLKTFSEYVTEIRINHACKLLMEKNYNVSEIALMSGFDNRANFYRHFKNQMSKTPKDFLRQFIKL